MAFVGIDLGTTFTCIAVMKNGKIEIVANEQGARTTPSCVAYLGNERVVGDNAKHLMGKNPENTIYDVKRIIGRRYKDPSVQSDRKNWPFKVVNKDGDVKIEVSNKEREMHLSPEQISSAVLEHVKKVAEDYLGEKITSAVLTVPAYFNDAQRRATKTAANVAGLYVLGMINEPTAAALAYGLENKSTEKRNVLIFDLGGGTFDVTVLTIEDQIYEVRATGGDSHLGGQDFNKRLYNHLLKSFAEKHKADLSGNEKAAHRLRVECETAKKLLSSALRTTVDIPNLHKNEDLELNISRAKFENLCEDFFRGTMGTVELVLDEAGLTKKEINDVVLVGGSSRIPYIQNMLREYFGENKICKTVNPDEAVAYGAAARAAFLSGDASSMKMTLHDVIPLSLGIETKGGVMAVFMKKNSRTPAKKLMTFVTSADNQTETSYRIFEGERAMVKLNHELGSFVLSGLPPLPAGEAQMEVCFEVDFNGVLHVSAKELSRQGNENKINITWGKDRLTKEHIHLMIKQAEWFQQADEETRNMVAARNNLESSLNKARRIIKEGKLGSAAKRNNLKAECEDLLKWMTEYPKASKAELETKQQKFDLTMGVFK